MRQANESVTTKILVEPVLVEGASVIAIAPTE
jgi:hypothetical protein